jgi:hypothetical protein
MKSSLSTKSRRVMESDHAQKLRPVNGIHILFFALPEEGASWLRKF